ncbi:MAG TPA: hypothetical protein VHG32_26430 [Thermoanaerobaculia bacterium]|nr:hypothetical protein [Thermoanaerobaculia bacterium]
MSTLREELQVYLQEAGRLELQKLGPVARPRRPPSPEALLPLRNAAHKARDSHRRMGVACVALLGFIILILGGSLIQGLIAGHLACGLVGGAGLALLLVQDRMRQLGIDNFAIDMMDAAMELPAEQRDRLLGRIFYLLARGGRLIGGTPRRRSSASPL